MLSRFCVLSVSLTKKCHDFRGVDIEPDNKGATLQDIVFRRCISLDNKGSGFQAELFNLDPQVDPPISITFEDCDVIWSDDFVWGKDDMARETNVNGFQVSGARISGSVSVIGGSVTGSAGAGLCVVDNPPGGPTVSFSNVVLRNVAKLDIGQNKGMHAAPIHLIDYVGGLGGVYLNNIVVQHQLGGAIAPALRYDAVSCAGCANAISLRGSTIFIRPATNATVDAGCGAASAIVTLDGQPSAGELFGRHVFENLSVVCCTEKYLATHPHDWQSFDGCRVAATSPLESLKSDDHHDVPAVWSAVKNDTS